jgi:hypothetical protein
LEQLAGCRSAAPQLERSFVRKPFLLVCFSEILEI